MAGEQQVKKHGIQISMAEGNEKIIVTGTGRSGTTFLMQLFTSLGYDTGMPNANHDFRKDVRAGMEFNYPFKIKSDDDLDYQLGISIHEAVTRLEQYPLIIKSPSFAHHLKLLIESGVMKVKHAIIPIRDVSKSAKSRIEVDLDTKMRWIDWDQYDPDRFIKQKTVLYNILGRLFEALSLHDIQYTVIKYPDMIYNADYLLERLKRVFPEIHEQDFYESHKILAKDSLVTIK